MRRSKVGVEGRKCERRKGEKGGGGDGKTEEGSMGKERKDKCDCCVPLLP